MEKQTMTIGTRLISIYSPSDCMDCPIVYVHSAKDSINSIAVAFNNTKVIIVVIDNVDWNHDLTPWSAPGVFRKEADFEGGADAYLTELTGIIVPAVEALLAVVPSFRAIAGYSIAGLFAVYALYRTDIFNRAASISGSLWYDGFLDFMRENKPLEIPGRVYFSLGDQEHITKNQRLAVVNDCTAEAGNIIRQLGTDTIFERNPGSHFDNVAGRTARGIKWLL